MTFENEYSLQDFLSRFEAGDIPAQQWSHAAHVAMAAAYVWEFDEAAFPRVRAGIHHLNWHHGTITTDDRGYHETLTRFWCEVLRKFLAENREAGRVPAINRAVASLPVTLANDYYSFDVVKSRDARRNWIAPDLKPIN